MTFIVAMIVAFAMTPVVRKLAFRIKAVDVPKDNRRMHKKPIPLIGGLAIFAGFMVALLSFSHIDGQMIAIIAGACIIVATGIVDDIYDVPAIVKLCVQIVAALIPVLSGVVIQNLTNPFADSGSLHLGIFAIPVTVFWIVAIVNAVNFIDGLDGLACGVSAISSITMFIVAYMVSEGDVVFAIAALAGACLGF
ncbi:MAG: undecaprenyl/decaprenyl-phosphate alpha-N-acetylglucosaminyl 1-phosphate transferase, partial [Clostridia bacterium]|nr:undecaprenyl/decaprenyl-phosphate alpha-N-acetylglucosaminyl 1-phosphate transferase [Clostridia bacterium]